MLKRARGTGSGQEAGGKRQEVRYLWDVRMWVWVGAGRDCEAIKEGSEDGDNKSLRRMSESHVLCARNGRWRE
jgi:hypothetical protein